MEEEEALPLPEQGELNVEEDAAEPPESPEAGQADEKSPLDQLDEMRREFHIREALTNPPDYLQADEERVRPGDTPDWGTEQGESPSQDGGPAESGTEVLTDIYSLLRDMPRRIAEELEQLMRIG